MADKFNQTELASFFENMGMMIRSGVSVAEAMSILSDEATAASSDTASVLRDMSDGLNSGHSLSEVMRTSDTFPGYAADMTATSEYTGKLEDTLFHLSDYYTEENRMQSALMSSIRYPAALLVMVIAVLTALLLLVFPTFRDVYENLTGSLGSSAYRYVNISFALCHVLLVLSILMLIAFILGVRLWNHGGRSRVRQALSRFPSMKKMFESMDLYRFTSCFEMFISAGENRDDALARSIPVAETPGVQSGLEHCKSLMSEGMSFSQAACESGLYDAQIGKLLLPAERSGMLDDVMQRLTDNLRTDTEAGVQKITNTAEPLLTGLLIVFIGIILISIMIPLIGIMNSVG